MNTNAVEPGTGNADIRLARAALTRLMEPSDLPGMALISVAGPVDALAFIRSGAASSAVLEQEMTAVLSETGTGRWQGLAEALGRWRPRLADLAPERDLGIVDRFGGGLLIPEDPQWPPALADLQLAEPIALWLRGRVLRIPEQKRCIAVVGSRDSTSYGDNVTGEIASSLVQRGFTVVSGGAYGIDANAHRGALGAARQDPAYWGAPSAGGTGVPPAEGAVAQPPTLAVMAGGVDRFYPSGNEDLLRTITEQGAVVAEVPPGTNPTRYRFLQRNRLIAALFEVTVVVEARWRSGALNTAHHAEGLSRSVGAVPGSVYSANSAGCHRLLREGAAVCVTDAADIAELAGVAGSNLAIEQEAAPALHDGLGVEDLLLLDALPLRSATSVDKLSVVAGLGTATVLAGLGRLELLGLAQRLANGWKRNS
ncbi:DNA-protecting protein DprA [Arthrobacter livingstonensis]|uniref:DNA-protecting protein DprA n=1 Tax=Arthrobacter livingstonensis TaxID=670078 RepID=A0A2V5L5G4_9MICC|nr:DNA-processing protein DprA [Arthrobacter livingstonensis]PYI66619.1 DNA-protecting protein DprA [Arthrobacter livingstonensis]